MAKDEIIIDIQIVGDDQIKKLSAMSAEVQRLKNENKELEKQKGKSAESDRVLNELITKNTLDYKELSGEIRQYEKTILNEVKTAKLAENSLNQMRAELSNLISAYDNLSQAERQSAKGKDMLNKIQGLTENLSLAEAETGRFQRMVGNYPDVFNLGSTSIGKFQKMLDGFGQTSQKAGFSFVGAFKSMGTQVVSFGKTLLTTPVGWIAAALAGLVAIVSKVTEAFKKSDDAMTSLQVAFDVFRPILKAVNDLFNTFVEAIAKSIEKIALFANSVASYFGYAQSEASKSLQQISADIDKLEDVERNYTINSAERDMKISKLRAEARDTENLTAKEREKLLKQAIELEKTNLKEYKYIASEKLRIMELDAKANADTSDETKNKIAQARAEMFKAEKAYFDGTRRLDNEYRSARKEQRDEAKRMGDEARKRREQELEHQRQMKEKELQLVRDFEDKLREQIKNEEQKAIADQIVKTEREIEALRRRLETEKDLTIKARQTIEDIIIEARKNGQEKINEIKSLADKKRWDDEVAFEQNRISLLLEIAEKESENETQLKLEQIELLRKIELKKAEETGADKVLINQKFDLQITEVEKNRLKKIEEQRRLALENEFEERRQKIYTQGEEMARLEIEIESKKLNELLNIDAELKKALFNNDDEYTSAVLENRGKLQKAEQDLINIQKDKFQQDTEALITFSDTVSAVLGEIGEDSEKMAIFQKTLALANASINLASAISSATAKSTQEVNPLIMAAKIVANVGAVVVAFSQVFKSIKSAMIPKAPKFARGGIVGGSSYHGDKVIARVNSGEMILNKEQQATLLAIARGGAGASQIDYSKLVGAFEVALEKQKPPILDYREFTDFQNKTTKFNNYANI